MNRLYWKIFLSFWLVIVVSLGIVLVINTSFFEAQLAEEQSRRSNIFQRLITEEAVEIISAGGSTALMSWLEMTQSESPDTVFVVDADGEDILSRDLPAWASQRYNLLTTEPVIKTAGMRGTPSQVLAVDDGKQYTLVVGRPKPGFPRMLLRPGYQELGLLVALLVSGVICFLLARYLTNPIIRLRETGQLIAGGDFTARTGAVLERRADELGELARDFDYMAERIEQLMTSQQRMLRDVSHELRSPLARLQAAVGLARQRGGGLANDELDRADAETETLNALIGQILSYARLQTLGEVNKELTDVDDLLSLIADDADFEAQSFHCRVTYDGCGKVLMKMESSLFRSAIENIVRNALRYTASGTNVEIIARANGALSIEIRDHGPGVPETSLPLLFEPFYRVEEARNPSASGGGVGLAIAERAIRLHEGVIRAENRETGGLVVVINLPLKDLDDA